MKAVTKRGIVKLGDVSFDTYVLEDGKRVCTQRTLVRALCGGQGGGNLEASLGGKKAAGMLNLGDPIRFETLDGIQAVGREISDIGSLCAQIIDAHINGTLPPEKIDLVRAANRLNGALANVALEALVDEATGYQAVRDGEYLRRRLQAFLRDDPEGWQRRFSPTLIKELSTLYGYRYDGGRLPRFLGGIFSKLYRVVLGEDVAGALRERNPSPSHGSNHHQHLTSNVQSMLETDLVVIEAMARTSNSPRDFWNRIASHFLRAPFQLSIDEVVPTAGRTH